MTVAPTLTYDSPTWAEFVERFNAHMYAGLPLKHIEAEFLAYIQRRCNARALVDDDSEEPLQPGAAFSGTIAILAALGFDIETSLDWLSEHGAACDCTVGFNVIADAPKRRRGPGRRR